MKGLKKPDPGGLLRPATGTEIAVGRAFYLDLYGWLGIAPQGATVGWFNQPVDREISPPGSASKAGPFFLTGCCPIYFRTAVARMSPKEKLLRPGGAASYNFFKLVLSAPRHKNPGNLTIFGGNNTDFGASRHFDFAALDEGAAGETNRAKHQITER